MYLLSIILPLFGSLLGITFGRYVGIRGYSIIALFLMFFSWVLSWIIYYEVSLSGSVVLINLGTWIDSELLNLSWCFLFDALTSLMLVVVLTVSLLVHLYSLEYMNGDPHILRFISYLSLFTFFMIILITASNFVQMFVGWEGVGLASYLLINFWFTRIQANKAAIKAMVVNRIGDFGLVVGVLIIYYGFKSLDYSVVFSLAPYLNFVNIVFWGQEINILTIIGVGLFIGVMGKSAQIGLHVWLPDAMEGPTPVSALIHAATMVTAGVFVMVRCSALLEFGDNVLFIITIFGSLTAFLGASVGVFQNDIKKIVAYSTCSQLGYMVFACGLSLYSVSFFHLFNHAFFKALLFLSSGSVIHAMGDEQDLRKMGGLVNLLPFTYLCFVVGSLALIGFPFLSGFYSKDLIFEKAGTLYVFESLWVTILGLFSALLTAYYSTKLLYLAFYMIPAASRTKMEAVFESGLLITIVLGVLFIFSMFSGYIFKEIIVGIGTDVWGSSIFVLPEHVFLIEFEFWNLFLKNLPFLTGVCGTLLALLLNTLFKEYLFVLKLTKLGRYIYIFFNRKWFFDLIYNHYIVNKSLDFGYYISFKLIDKGVLEWIGPFGISKLAYKFSAAVTSLQTGIIYNYALFMFLGFICFIGLSFVGSFIPSSALSIVKLILFIATIFTVAHLNK